MTRTALARCVADRANLDPDAINARPTAGFSYVLVSERGNVMPSSEDALTHYFRDCALIWVNQ
jgi:hypothetical protein